MLADVPGCLKCLSKGCLGNWRPREKEQESERKSLWGWSTRRDELRTERDEQRKTNGYPANEFEWMWVVSIFVPFRHGCFPQKGLIFTCHVRWLPTKAYSQIRLTGSSTSRLCWSRREHSPECTRQSFPWCYGRPHQDRRDYWLFR